MTALIQHFSVPANNDVQVVLAVFPDAELASAIYWRAYDQQFGIPLYDDPASPPPIALIEKSMSEGTITVSSPPTSCAIQFNAADTVDLLRNYYHETTMIDAAGNVSTLNQGIMTVTQTVNR